MCRPAWTRTDLCSPGYQQLQSNRLGSGRRDPSGKPFLSFVLDSRRLVFCFVLRSKSAPQKAPKNPSILDSSYRYFDTGTGHLLPIHVRMDTFQKRVIDENKDRRQSNRQNLLTAAYELTQNFAVFTQEFEDWFSIGPHCEVNPHPTILIAQF